MSIDIKWFPPAWFQIKTGKKIIYIDPAYLKKYYKNYPKKVEFSSWPDPIDGLPEKDLEKADVILVTHHHKDHCKRFTVNRLMKQDSTIIAPERCSKELGEEISFILPEDEIEIDHVRIKAIEAYNIKRGHNNKVIHKKGVGVGYIIKIEGRTIYHAGDTDFIPEMIELGKIDVALLPIGGRDFTMNLTEAVQAAVVIKPLVAIPIHRFEADPQEFKKQVEKKSDIKVAALQTGEVYHLK